MKMRRLSNRLRKNRTVCEESVKTGEILLYSSQHVMANYSSSMNGVSSTSEIIRVATWWETLLRVLIAVFAALTVGSAAAMAVDYRKRRKKGAKK